VIIVPALAYSYMKLNLRWLINGSIALAIGIGLKHGVLKEPWTDNSGGYILSHNSELIAMAILSLISLSMTELYRRSHHYLITTARIRTSSGVFSKRERTLPLSKINDLYTDQGFFGKFLGFATVVPLTASGMGMGSDFAALAGSISKAWFGIPTIGLTIIGGHNIQVPKSRTHEALFGIYKADKAVNGVMGLLVHRELKMNE